MRGGRVVGWTLGTVWGLGLALGVGVQAADLQTGLEVGPYFGVVAPDEDLVGDGSSAEFLAGVRVGWIYDSHWGFHADVQGTPYETNTFAGDADQITGRVMVDYRLNPRAAMPWFVEAGVGATQITFDEASDFESGIVSLGVGQRLPIAGNWRFRWQLRAEQTLAADGLRGEDVTQGYFLFGAQWGARRGRTDRDGDGVPDMHDRCPDSAPGARVERDGCDGDSDGDGVRDGADQCPRSREGTVVNAEGCPEGDDGDGVPHYLDSCPGTPKGAVVDARGCPKDSDRDGVLDGIDVCPGTLRGIEVDDRGCFIDKDGDGVYDGKLGYDRCPNTPRGTEVDEFGCPKKKG